VSVLDAIRRANTTARPEESVTLRIATTASVMLGVAAVLASGAAPAVDAVAALVLLPLGAWVSWRRRAEDNLVIKAVLTVGAGLALWRFFGDVAGSASLDDTRAPLASLFLAVQVLHGFDLPQRRDLGFTLVSSLALVALAATSTHSGLFGLLLVAYVVLAGTSLAGIQRSAARERADHLREEVGGHRLRGGDPEEEPAPTVGRRSVDERASTAARVGGRLARSGSGLLRAAGPVMLIGALVFSLLPRSSGGQLGTLPFRGFPRVELPSSLVHNPGLDGAGLATPADRDGAPLAFDPTAYFGFAEYVDLRTVGELDDTPVMRVRADRPRLWRGMVFDTYDGRGWNRSSEVPEPTFGQPVTLAPHELELAREQARTGGSPVHLALEQRWEHGDELGESTRVVQTYELVADTPNLVFAAAEPHRVYVAGGSVYAWDDGTISTGQLMDAETIYSVVSRVRTTPPPVLRERAGATPDAIAATYTQLPASLPARVRSLAADITAGTATNYRAAEAVQAWLRDHTEYTLDAPPPPEDADAVDHFLFEARQGWCEPIAASMTVLLRAAGIPARFATGYQPGRRNPISGVYDVVMSDAHAWVEVWVPETGWVTFDPTGAVPAAVSNDAPNRIPLIDAVRWLGDVLGELGLGAAGTWVRRAITGLGQAPGAAAGLLVGLLGLTGAAVALGGARRRRRDPDPTPFARLEALLAGQGVHRDGWQTPREYVERVRLHRPDLPSAHLDLLLADEEQRRYGTRRAAAPSPRAAEAVEAIAVHLADAARTRRATRR
jgi:protein-glutamine gamma-glutamyltransferase